MFVGLDPAVTLDLNSEARQPHGPERGGHIDRGTIDDLTAPLHPSKVIYPAVARDLGSAADMFVGPTAPRWRSAADMFVGLW